MEFIIISLFGTSVLAGIKCFDIKSKHKDAEKKRRKRAKQAELLKGMRYIRKEYEQQAELERLLKIVNSRKQTITVKGYKADEIAHLLDDDRCNVYVTRR